MSDIKQMTTSDFNLQKLGTKELSEHISATIEVCGNIAVFGRRGIGKTQIPKQEIKKTNMREVYINLSVLERVDLGGYPNIMASAMKQKFVDFLLPQFYEPMLEGSEGVVALLDEVDKTDPSLWAPLLEFTQFRSINGRSLKNLRAVIMTGNLISEGGSRPSLPLLDRAEKYLVEANAKDWLDWSGKVGHIHPSVTAYISDHPKDLNGAVDPENRYADPSPRGWDRVSDLLFRGEKHRWSSTLLSSKVCGCVGKDAGIKYSNYYEHYQQLLPMIEQVFKGENIHGKFKVLEPTKKLVVTMMTLARLANQLDKSDPKHPPEFLKYIGKFLQHVDQESVLICIRSQLQIDRVSDFDLDSHPDWAPFWNGVLAKMENN